MTQFCGAFLEHHVVESAIHDLHLAYEKIAEGAGRTAKGIGGGDLQDDIEQYAPLSHSHDDIDVDTSS